jgi:hypothetical protein
MIECGTRAECADIADKAVKKTFAILGVNVDDPASIEEFRQDLRFGKRLRKLADHGGLAFAAAVSIAIAAAIWAGVAEKLGK